MGHLDGNIQQTAGIKRQEVKKDVRARTANMGIIENENWSHGRGWHFPWRDSRVREGQRQTLKGSPHFGAGEERSKLKRYSMCLGVQLHLFTSGLLPELHTQLTPHKNQPSRYYSVGPKMLRLAFLTFHLLHVSPPSALMTCLPIHRLTLYLGNKVPGTAVPTLTLCFSPLFQLELSLWQHCLLLTRGQSITVPGPLSTGPCKWYPRQVPLAPWEGQIT